MLSDIELKEMEIGDEKIVDINADIDEKILKISGGFHIKKGQILTLSDEKGREYYFEVKRIIAGSYVVLVQRGKKPKLGLSDAFRLSYLALTKRRF